MKNVFKTTKAEIYHQQTCTAREFKESPESRIENDKCGAVG